MVQHIIGTALLAGLEARALSECLHADPQELSNICGPGAERRKTWRVRRTASCPMFVQDSQRECTRPGVCNWRVKPKYDFVWVDAEQCALVSCMLSLFSPQVDLE